MKNLKFYTGVGSRQTPEKILSHMTSMAKTLSDKGYILRSGGADGADTAFENGAFSKEIYLPWKGFNNNTSQLYDVCEEAIKLAKDLHPKGNSLRESVLRLHARNCYQVLGKDLNTPSEFLICWTVGGEAIGGTATAIRLAERWGIPVINLGNNYDTLLLDTW